MNTLSDFDFVRVTEAAALAAARTMGTGDRHHADHVATEAMRVTLNNLSFSGTIVIGEGERDEAPMLYIGERVGSEREQTESEIAIAVDPLEGTNLVATGADGALAVMAISEMGGLLAGPDVYMNKLVTAEVSSKGLDITAPVSANLQHVARNMNREINDIVVAVLERDRHEQLIADIRATGARVKLITDGDVAAGISAMLRGTDIHVLMGSGGAPEGVITAAAAKCMKGWMQGQFVVRHDEDKQRLAKAGYTDAGRVLHMDDLAPGNKLMFIATGVTSGSLVRGVRYFGGGAKTESLIANFQTGEVRFIDTTHMFDREAVRYIDDPAV